MTRKLIKRITGKYGDGILSIVANFIQKGTFLIVTILLARIFGPKLFGEYVFLKQTFDVLIVFILFGGDKSLIYFSAIDKNDGLKKLLSVIKFAIIIVIILFLVSLSVQDKLLANYHFSSNLFFLLLFSATILLNIILLFIEGYFVGIKSLKTYFKSVILAAIFYLPLSYFFGYKYGLVGVFLAMFVHYLVQFIYIYFKENKLFKKESISNLKKDLKQLYTFSFPIGIGELLIKNTNFEELGIYNVAIRMVMFIVFIPNLLNNILLSYLSIKANKENFLFKTVLLNLVLSGLVGFIFYVFSNQIFALFGAEFKESGTDVFINLIYAILPFCSSLVLLQYLISIKKRWSYLFFRFLREGLTIAFFGLFIKLDFEANALLLSKCFLYSNYISLTLLTLFIIINYFNERKKINIKI
jgi:O-antigen/teichoic acid export membrane protein